MNKKKKSKIAKRRLQAKPKKQKRAKVNTHRSSSDVQFSGRPAMSEIKPPPGFRAVSVTQAVMEFAKPVMEFVDNGVVKDPNTAFQLAMPLWNYDISIEEGKFDINQKDIIKLIEKTLKLKGNEAIDFFEMMLQRKQDLFPKDIQPKHSMTMFVKQVEHHLIPEFNYDSLLISDETYIPTTRDEEFLSLLNQMDEYISDEIEYDEWEDHYFETEKQCSERFQNWLSFKGITDYKEDFPYNVEVYLNFIYRYMHDDDIILKTVTAIYIEEFFADYVLRKVIVEPHEYISWPPALKLFYQFLQEIGYIEKPEKIIRLIDNIEPIFIKILKSRYS